MTALRLGAWRTAQVRNGGPASGGGENIRVIEGVINLAAAAMLITAVSASMMEKDPADGDTSGAGASGAAAASVAPGAEWMVGAYGGAPYTYPSDVKISKTGTHDFTAKDVEWQAFPFDNPIYYGVRIARWFGDTGRTGAMLDFTHSKAISKKEQETRFEGTVGGATAPEKALLKDVFSRLEASHGHNMLTLNGMLRLPSFNVRFSPYVGLGAGVNLPHAEVHVKGEPSRTYEYQYTGPVGQALIGVEFRLPRMSYFLEYKFSLADYRMPLSGRDGYILFTDLWNQFQNWMSGAEPPGGWAETRYTSHQVIGGLAVRIGGMPAAVAP